VSRKSKPDSLKIALSLDLATLIDGLAITEQNEIVERITDLRARLVDDDDRGSPQVGKCLERSHNR
jgi:hypothetical protein